MISHRYLIADTNLEVVHETGTRISLQLSQGQGVVELSDAGMLRRSFQKSAKPAARRWLRADSPTTPAMSGPTLMSNFSRPGEKCIHNLGYWRLDRVEPLNLDGIERQAARDLASNGNDLWLGGYREAYLPQPIDLLTQPSAKAEPVSS